MFVKFQLKSFFETLSNEVITVNLVKISRMNEFEKSLIFDYSIVSRARSFWSGSNEPHHFVVLLLNSSSMAREFLVSS